MSGFFPDTRPDGLVRQGQLRQILGIGENTLLRWQSRGWIAPEKREGNCTLYHVPAPERIEEIRALAAQRLAEGAKRGRERAIESGGNLASAARGRDSKTQQAQARAAQGLLNKRALGELLGVHNQTLAQWIEQGIIAPTLVSPSGKWMWFTIPDEATMERLRGVAKVRSKASIGAPLKADSTREKRPYAKRVPRTINIVEQVKAKLRSGTMPEGALSFSDAASRAGIALDSFHGWIKKGWVPTVGEGRYGRGIMPEFLDAFVAERIRLKELKQDPSEKVPAGLVSSTALCKQVGISDATLSPEHLEKITASQDALRAAARPEGALTCEEAAEYIGTSIHSLRKLLEKGKICRVEGSRRPIWILRSEMDRYQVGKAETIEKVAQAQTIKIVAPRPSAPARIAAPVPVAADVRTPANADFVPYDVAVVTGRANPCFNNALGFNLLSHPDLGFRPAKVNEKPEGGWRYHERHGINGWGQWQIKAQKPTTGEVLL